MSQCATANPTERAIFTSNQRTLAVIVIAAVVQAVAIVAYMERRFGSNELTTGTHEVRIRAVEALTVQAIDRLNTQAERLAKLEGRP